MVQEVQTCPRRLLILTSGWTIDIAVPAPLVTCNKKSGSHKRSVLARSVKPVLQYVLFWGTNRLVTHSSSSAWGTHLTSQVPCGILHTHDYHPALPISLPTLPLKGPSFSLSANVPPVREAGADPEVVPAHHSPILLVVKSGKRVDGGWSEYCLVPSEL